MLREQINDIMVRWNPKERRVRQYDPARFLETPEQARKLLRHLQNELDRARKQKNAELILEVSEILARVESLSKRFFRWEQTLTRSMEAEDLKEIEKLPLGF